jgi:hypothetical protein
MENFVPLTPINFFQLKCICHYIEPGFPKLVGPKLRSYLLPNTSQLCHEYAFAEIAMGWNREGIEFAAVIAQPYHRAAFPNIMQGDSVELFFDTRDVKTAGFNTRFCHHFYFLPEEVDDHLKGEITKFRTEDTHDLCDPSELKVVTHLKKNGYTLQIFIPAHCLFGYDPDQFDRIGFAYRVNRTQGSSQHFCVVTEDYQIEQQPSLWSSIKLVK